MAPVQEAQGEVLTVLHVQDASAAALQGTVHLLTTLFYVCAGVRKLENAAMHCHLSGQGGPDSNAELRDKSSKSISGMANSYRMVIKPISSSDTSNYGAIVGRLFSWRKQKAFRKHLMVPRTEKRLRARHFEGVWMYFDPFQGRAASGMHT